MADPQVNPNALGAPAEGFGQTVSFAFDPRGVTPSLALAKSPGPGGGGVGPTSHASQVNPNVAFNDPPKPDGTAALIMKVGADVMAPRIEAARNAQFITGIQRAMQGEAIADMDAERPWYSKLFGDTPMIEGARAYTVGNKVNTAIATETANMDTLKAMGPNEASKYFAAVIGKNMTGDTSTDALITKHMIDQLPGLMKAQAKAHYGYGQQKAMTAMSVHMDSAGAALQQAGELYSQDYISEKDMDIRRDAYVQAIMPPMGINEENYGKVLAANLRKAADGGHFHAVEAIRKSGGFNALTVEQQNAANAAVTAAATKHRNNYANAYIKEMAEVRSDMEKPATGGTVGGALERATKMNEAYRKVSGSPLGLWSSDELASMATGGLNHMKAEVEADARRAQVLADRNATATDKAAAEAEKAARVERLVNDGQAYIATKVEGVSKDEVDVTFASVYDKATPASGSFMLRENFIKGAYVNDVIKQRLQEPFRRAVDTDKPDNEFFKGVDKYEAMKAGAGGVVLAHAYFGDQAAKIERFSRLTQGEPSGEQSIRAFQATFHGDSLPKATPIPQKEMVALAKQVTSKLSGIMPRIFAGDLRDDAARTVSQYAAKYVSEWQTIPGLTAAEATAHGITAAVTAREVELIGGYAVGRPGVNSKAGTLKEIASRNIKVPDGNHDKYFARFIHTKTDPLGEFGWDTFKPGTHGGTVTILHGGMTNGVAHFGGSIEVNGETKLFKFTGDEWAASAEAQTLRDTGVRPAMPYVFGPDINSTSAGITPNERARQAALAADAEYRSRKRIQQ